MCIFCVDCMLSRLMAAWIGNLMASSDKSARKRERERERELDEVFHRPAAMVDNGVRPVRLDTLRPKSVSAHEKMWNVAIFASRTSRPAHPIESIQSKERDEFRKNLQIKTKFIKHNPINRSTRRATNLIKVLNRIFYLKKCLWKGKHCQRVSWREGDRAKGREGQRLLFSGRRKSAIHSTETDRQPTPKSNSLASWAGEVCTPARRSPSVLNRFWLSSDSLSLSSEFLSVRLLGRERKRESPAAAANSPSEPFGEQSVLPLGSRLKGKNFAE